VNLIDATNTIGTPLVGAETMVEAKGLTKSFQLKSGTHHVLNDINLQIARGSFTSVIGPSGCGKSSLLMCLAGLSAATSGAVEIGGRVISSPPKEATYLFQQYSKSVFPWRTVRQNAEYGLEVAGVSKKVRRSMSADILARVGLSKFADRYPSELSGGMQQRLAIARALVCEPKILLMDEPFSAVDALTRAQLQDLVLDIWQDAALTIIFVTHDVDEAVYLSDRVISLGRDAGGIQLDIDIELPRPRDQISTRESAEFIAYRHRLLDLVLSEHHPDGDL
jgi:NitT/TauT family transport system ATP-binding protein